MSRSTRLITASYILAFVASNAPKRLRTDTIAKWVKTHPSRVRQLCTQLVKAGILTSYRGQVGGLTLARKPEEISLQCVYDAVQESPLIAERIDNPFSEWDAHCHVHAVFKTLFADMECDVRAALGHITLDKMFVPYDAPFDDRNSTDKRSLAAAQGT